MAMLPSEMAVSAKAAELHAQLAIERIEVDDELPAEGHDAHVFGMVVRVFRGDQALLGQSMTWVVEVLVPGDEPSPSGTLWTRIEDLRSVRVLEAFVSQTNDGEHRVVLGMTTHLDAPTDAAQAQHFEQAEEEEFSSAPASRIATGVKIAAVIALGSLLIWVCVAQLCS